MPKRDKTDTVDYEYLGRPKKPAEMNAEFAAETNPAAKTTAKEAKETKANKAKPKGRC